MKTKNKTLAFKDLLVWQKAIQFASDVIELTENLNTNSKHFRLIEQLESSAASVSQNIAEGKGRISQKEFVHFLYIARGSLYESITLLILFEKRQWISTEILERMEAETIEIASMIKGLIKSISQL